VTSEEAIPSSQLAGAEPEQAPPTPTPEAEAVESPQKRFVPCEGGGGHPRPSTPPYLGTLLPPQDFQLLAWISWPEARHALDGLLRQAGFAQVLGERINAYYPLCPIFPISLMMNSRLICSSLLSGDRSGRAWAGNEAAGLTTEVYNKRGQAID
jgi:hypothetical protein